MSDLQFAYGLNANSWYETIIKNGLGNGLQLCLDASDGRSYDGSSQTWSDLSSSAYHWDRGADSSATATDPTFNGSANGFSSGEYWSFDGGDYFTPTAGGGGNTFINSIHKNNAVFSIAIWARLGTHTPSNQYMFGNTQGAASAGFFFGFSTAAGLGNGRLRFAIYNGASSVYDVAASSFAVPTAGQWYLWGVSIDEAAGTGYFYQNGSSQAITPTYASPSASNSSNSLTIGAINTALPLTNNSRLASLATWDRSLTSAEFDILFERTRGKFGV